MLQEHHSRRRLANVKLTRRFHFRYMGLWILLSVCLVVVVNLLLYLVLSQQWGGPHAGSPAYQEYAFIRSGWLTLLGLEIAFFGVAIVALAVITAHRIAGPFLRLMYTFQEIRQGERDRRLHFRRDDHLDDLEAGFNAMLDELTKGDPS